MKKILRTLWLGAVALCAAGSVASCSDDDPVPTPYEPKITISDVTATGSSVQFTLTPTDAVRYTYAVAPKGETADPVSVESDKATTQKVEDLEADITYTITAVAFAADGTRSQAATHDFTTNPKATVVVGEQIEVTFFSARLILTPTNATSVSYTHYPAQARPDAPKWVEVSGNGPIEVTLDELESETEYVLEAYASNGDGDGDPVKSPVFRTDAAPSVEIGEVTATATTAACTLTPSHASGMKYTCYPAGQRPSEPEWTDLAQDAAVDVTISKLTPATSYVIEALAYTAAGEGEAVVSEPFATAELPALSVRTAATSSAIWVRFEINPAKTPAYYFSSPVDPADEWANFTTAEGFLADIKENGWAYELKTDNYEIVAPAGAATTFKVFAVCADADGNADAASVQEVTVVTPALDLTGSGKATVEIANVAPQAISIDADLRFSDDCVMYAAGAVMKEDVDRVGGLTLYVNMNLASFHVQSAAQLENPYSFAGLKPQTDYFLFAIAIDNDGKFGAIVSEQTRTEAVSYDSNVTVNFSIYQADYTSMLLNADVQHAATVRYRNMARSEFDQWYNGDADAIFTELFDPMADVLFFDEDGRCRMDWLTYNTNYILFALPVKEDGSFGTPTQFSYKTLKFEATGTAEVTFGDTTQTPDGSYLVTITPGAGCAKFIYMPIGQEVYELNSRKLGEYVMSSGYYDTVDPAEETTVEVYLWGEDTYLTVIACDAEGNWSEPVFHRFAYSAD